MLQFVLLLAELGEITEMPRECFLFIRFFHFVVRFEAENTGAGSCLDVIILKKIIGVEDRCSERRVTYETLYFVFLIVTKRYEIMEAICGVRFL